MFCIHCGAPNPEDASFCGTCGKTIGGPANPPVPTEAFQHVHSSAEQSSWNATGQTPAQISLPTQPPAQSRAQYQPAAPGGKAVLWLLAGFAACLLIVIAVALGSRQSQPSTAPEATRADSSSDAPPAAVPVADNTPAPVSTPVQAPAASSAPTPAPPPPPPAPPQNSIVGDWTTTTFVGSHISLHFGADGQYTLTDISGTEEGVYVFSSGDGTLRRQPKAIFSHNIIVWSCQLLGDSLSCVDANGGGHVYSRVQ